MSIDDDGRFLVELWERRRSFYPAGRADLLVRFVRDALRVADAEAGHRAVSAYEMERRLGLVAAPTLLVGHARDIYAFGDLMPLHDALREAGVEVTIGDDRRRHGAARVHRRAASPAPWRSSSTTPRRCEHGRDLNCV